MLACKSDLERRVDPQRATAILKQYDAGVVEVSATDSAGKEKIRDAFDFILTIISQERKYCHIRLLVFRRSVINDTRAPRNRLQRS